MQIQPKKSPGQPGKSGYAQKVAAREKAGLPAPSSKTGNLSAEMLPPRRFLPETQSAKRWPIPDLPARICSCFFIVMRHDSPSPCILTLEGNFKDGHVRHLPRYNNFSPGNYPCQSTCEFGLAHSLARLAINRGFRFSRCHAGGYYSNSIWNDDLKRAWCLTTADLDPVDHFCPMDPLDVRPVWKPLCGDLIREIKPGLAMAFIYAKDALKLLYEGQDNFFEEISRVTEMHHRTARGG